MLWHPLTEYEVRTFDKKNNLLGGNSSFNHHFYAQLCFPKGNSEIQDPTELSGKKQSEAGGKCGGFR